MIRLWPLPALVAILPLLATAIAFALSARHGHIDACNPFWDGCVSISRAARHGLGNHVFRAIMLPCATLQIAFWWLCRHWLRSQGRPAGRMIAALGTVAGLFLVLYATFLGTEGDVYRLLRQYGVIVYFAATYLAFLLALRSLGQPPRSPVFAPLRVVAAGMLLLGIANPAASVLVADAAFGDRLENVFEWHLGLWLTAMFALFARQWRREQLTLRLDPRTSL